MTYSYFPGCSLHSTGLEYELSTQAVCHHLGIDLVELKDWNCCGASSAHALDHSLAIALPARNLALAQARADDLVIACAACFNRLKAADYTLKHDLDQRTRIEKMVGFEYSEKVHIRPLLSVLAEDYGCENIASQVKHPLHGLKVVPYYGCLWLRPPHITQFENPDDPQIMGILLRSLGAEVLPWSHATDCCGAGLSLSRADVVRDLVGHLVERAREAGAQALVTACPLCQVNLEMRQAQKPRLPSFYFTELIGLALGLPATRTWWSKHLVDPVPTLKSVGLIG